MSPNTREDGVLIFNIIADRLFAFVVFLQENRFAELLLDIFAIDRLGEKLRFEIVYNFLSISKNVRVNVKIRVNEEDMLESITGVFESACWYEREVFDMFGISFKNLSDHRRILTDYNFEGYPLRKDFPLWGYKEVYYDKKSKSVEYRPVKLEQEYREFDFLSPWSTTLPGDEKGDEK